MTSLPERTETLTVGPEARGERLDRWLSAAIDDLTRNRIQGLITASRVLVDGEPRPARYRLEGGETIVVTVPAPESTGLEPDASVAFEVVYEDDDLAVVDKPAGVVVHPAPGHREGTLVHGLMARLSSLSGVGGRARPGLVHRLDRDTSGLLVVAKNDVAHQALADQLHERTLGRIYRAICWGKPEDDQGRIDQPLDRDPRDRKRRAIVEGGRRAVTDYRVEQRGRGASLVRLRLKTGRTHQIRVHLAHLGHPVLGDPLYGGGESRLAGAHPEHRRALRAALEVLGRQALHAWKLRFVHPRSGEPMEFVAELPATFVAAWEHLR